MKLYRKKPVEIEAIRIREKNREIIERLPEYGKHVTIIGTRTGTMALNINTSNGWVYASEGDWLCRDTDGALYPCKHSVFKATHERV